MKITNKNKIILISCVLSVLVLLGDVIFTPKLINADKPFIDLSGSVGDSVGNAQSAYAIANPAPTPVTSPVESDYDLVIMISDENIFVDDSLVTFENLKNDIAGGKLKGKTVLLLDDYAEYFTFKAVRNALSNNSITFDYGMKLFNNEIVITD